MASLRRHPKSSFFVACFTGEGGKRYQRSTGIRADGKISSRRQAQRVADQYEDIARRQHSARQIQKVFHEIYREVTGEALPDQSLRQYSADWLKDRKGAVASRSHGFYTSRVESLLQSLAGKADAPMLQITETDIRVWRDNEAKRVSTSTTNHGLKVLRMLFGDARKRNLISFNPAELVPILKREAISYRRPFTMEEIKTLLNHVEGEWRSLVLFGLYTGQRLGDLARLEWSAINLESNEIRFTTGKTGRHQKIPICAPLLSHILSLKNLSAPRKPVHPEAFDILATQGKASTLSRQFHEILQKAGLAEKKKHRKKVGIDSNDKRKASDLTFHCFRHTLTSMLKNAGVSASITEEIVGHDSTEMNRIYTHLEDKTLKHAMDQLPDVTAA